MYKYCIALILTISFFCISAAAKQSYNSPPIAAIRDKLGGGFTGITIDNRGRVIDVLPSSPAEAKGIRIGDTVITIDKKRVEVGNKDSIVKQLSGSPGTLCKIVYLRAGKKYNVEFLRIFRHEYIHSLGIQGYQPDIRKRIVETLTKDEQTAGKLLNKKHRNNELKISKIALAKTELAKGNLKSAMEFNRQAYEIAPIKPRSTFASLSCKIARSYYSSKSYEKAAAICLEGIKVARKEPTATNELTCLLDCLAKSLDGVGDSIGSQKARNAKVNLLQMLKEGKQFKKPDPFVEILGNFK